MESGYLGVDVFFVISGYLICRALLTRKSFGLLELLKFMKRRFERLAFPLALVTLIVMIFSLTFLGPITSYTNVKMGFWSLAFLSNYSAFADGGYFTAGAKNWLLHTWSLSVEMQFYCITAISYLLILKLTPNRNILIISLMIASLFSASLIFVGNQINTNLVFYFFATRYWEFGAGATTLLIQRKISSGFLAHIPHAWRFVVFIGIIMALLCLPSTEHVGFNNALIVIASCCFLMLQTQLPLIGLLKPLIWLGTRSYSIYLVHLPILLFFDLVLPRGDDVLFLGIALIPSLVFGHYLFELIERKFVNSPTQPNSS